MPNAALTKQKLKIIKNLVSRAGQTVSSDRQIEALAGDGSSRGFYRVFLANGASLMAVLPDLSNPLAVKEARSSFLICRHLLEQKIPAPELFGYDQDSGIILFEDLGEVLFHRLIREKGQSDNEIRSLYRQAIEVLVRFQLEGVRDFKPEFCFDTVRYDTSVMLERESGYFLSAFCRNYMGIADFLEDLPAEFRLLAARAARLPADYLLHRDFQSRNLMIFEGRVRIIDFQGARFGPLAYDLASLLIDPYAALSDVEQRELFSYYLFLLEKHISLDPDQFREGYYYMALQRNLQIVGAFAYLAKEKGKTFFQPYLLPALETLKKRLQEPRGRDFPYLLKLVAGIWQQSDRI